MGLNNAGKKIHMPQNTTCKALQYIFILADNFGNDKIRKNIHHFGNEVVI